MKLTPELQKYIVLDNLLDEVLTSSRKSNHVDIQALMDEVLNNEEFADVFNQYNKIMEDNSNGSEYI